MSINVKVRTKKKDLDYNRVLYSLADHILISSTCMHCIDGI